MHVGGRPTKRPYVFTNGFLRCGRCGGAMIPRTGTQKHGPDGTPWGGQYERYLCHTRVRDVSACDQPPVPRADQPPSLTADAMVEPAVEPTAHQRRVAALNAHRPGSLPGRDRCR